MRVKSCLDRNALPAVEEAMAKESGARGGESRGVSEEKKKLDACAGRWHVWVSDCITSVALELGV